MVVVVGYFLYMSSAAALKNMTHNVSMLSTCSFRNHPLVGYFSLRLLYGLLFCHHTYHLRT